jgi:hypothetical protein
MRRSLTAGCGCTSSLLLAVIAIPFLTLTGGAGVAGTDSGAFLGSLNVPREVAWQPFFPWSPGVSAASGWPWGQCTWFVVSQGHASGNHRVVWSGDAYSWFTNAATAGVSTLAPSTAPHVGWIAVFDRGHGSNATAGHVAVVIAVGATTYTIAEANELGLGTVDERTLPWPEGSAKVVGTTPQLEGWIS